MALQITGSLDGKDLVFLPWSTPLEEWPAEYVVALPRGISRHVIARPCNRSHPPAPVPAARRTRRRLIE